jgi:allantoinase
MSDLVIRGGSLVTAEGVVRADLGIDEGQISAIARELPGGARAIDARGLTVLPGLIDIHVHFNEPGRTEWEGAATGSRALATGGATVFFDMPLNSSPCTIGAAEFDAKLDALERSSILDFALWGGIIPGNRDALAELAECGVIGYKAFMADSGLPEFPRADDLTLYEGMREAARLGLPVAVHAESQDLTKPRGGSDIRAFLESRPVLAEVEAIRRAALLAAETGVKLHLVHVSSGRGVAAALEARAHGVDVSIETCPHYLFFTEEDLYRIGAVAKCAPPLRTAVERECLWAAVVSGQVDMVASDHSPAPPDMKCGDNFLRVWGGIAGGQSTLSVLLTRGVPLERIAHLTASEPARRFAIARKGRIAPGYDADLALVDLAARFTLQPEHLQQRHRLSPYIGAEFRGVVRHTLLRGEPAGQARGRRITHASSGTHA